MMELPPTAEPESLSKEGFECRTISPYTTLTLSDWKEVLAGSFPEFTGNKENGALLLYEFAQGAKWAIEKYKSKGLEIQDPSFGIVVNSEYTKHPFAYDSPTNAMFIPIHSLNTSSLFDMAKTYPVSSLNGEIGYEGTIPNFFRTGGVEEAHHAIYTQYKGLVIQEHPDGGPAAYRIADNEFAALRAQIRYAVETGMDPETIGVFQKILEQARELRKASKLQG